MSIRISRLQRLHQTGRRSASVAGAGLSSFVLQYGQQTKPPFLGNILSEFPGKINTQHLFVLKLFSVSRLKNIIRSYAFRRRLRALAP